MDLTLVLLVQQGLILLTGYIVEIAHQELIPKKVPMVWMDVLLVRQEVSLMLARALVPLVRLEIMQ